MLKTDLKLDIETTGGSFQLPEYPVNPTLAIFARKLMNTACEQGHFERVSTSRYASPAFVILKPGQEVKEMYADILTRTKNGETDFADIDPGKVVRVVSDMRRLNSITKVQTGTIVTLPEVMAQLQSNTVFSAFDLKHMFRSIGLSPDASEKATIRVFGQLYRPRLCLEGLAGVPALACSISSEIPQRSKNDALVYVDDFLVKTVGRDKHRVAVRNFFLDIRDSNGLISAAKIKLATSQITFLGHVIRYDPDINAVISIPVTQAYRIFKDYPLPKSTSDLQRFLGLCTWIQEFIPHYQIIASPLFQILGTRVKSKTKQHIDWESHQVEHRAFDLLCRKMLNVRPHVVLSEKFPLRILCDSNHFGFSASIQSKINEKWYTSAMYSKRFPFATIRCTSSINKELLGLLLCLHKWRRFLVMRDDVEVLLDCKSLVHLIAKSNSPGENTKANRWLAKITEYNLKFIHHTGRKNLSVQDALANRFIPENQDDDPHFHLAQYTFAKAQRAQVKIPFLTCKSCERDGFDPTVIQAHALEAQAQDEVAQIVKEIPTTPLKTFLPWHSSWSNKEVIIEDVNKIDIHPRYLQPFLEINLEEIRKAQLNDSECQNIISRIWKPIETSKIPERMKRFHMVGGILCRTKSKKEPTDNTNLAIVLCRPLITRLIASVHAVGHPSGKKMRKQISRYFYHSQLRSLTNIISSGCKLCQDYKNYGSREGMPEGILKPPRHPCDILYADIFYMQPAKYRGKRYVGVLQIIDGFSLYSWGQAITSHESEHVLDILEAIIPHVGPTSEFRTDNATNLNANSKVQAFFTELGIKPQTVIAYHSQGNSLCELSNKLLRQQINFYTDSFGGPWPKHVFRAKHAMNLIPHKIEKLSELTPYELVHGKKPANGNPLHFLDQLNPDAAKIIHQTNQRAIKTFQDERYKCMERIAKERWEKSRIKPGAFVRMYDIDRKSKQKPFVVADRVYKVTDRLQHLVKLVNVKDEDERIRTHIKKVRLIQERPTSVFGELPAFQQQLLGRPLTQRQLRKLLKRGHLHPDFDPDEKSNILQEGSQVSVSSSSNSQQNPAPATNQHSGPAKSVIETQVKTDLRADAERLADWITKQKPVRVKTFQEQPDKSDQHDHQNHSIKEEREIGLATESVLNDLPKSVRDDFRTMSTKLSRRVKRFQSSAQHKIEKLISSARNAPRSTTKEETDKMDILTETQSVDSKSSTHPDITLTEDQRSESTPHRSSVTTAPRRASISTPAPPAPGSETSATSTTTHAATPPRAGRGLRNHPRVDYKQLHTTGRKIFK